MTLSYTNHIRKDSSGRAISPAQIPPTDNTQQSQERETSMIPAGFEPTIPASERTQTHALDSADIGIGDMNSIRLSKFSHLHPKPALRHG
jgi:hypothetical protein